MTKNFHDGGEAILEAFRNLGVDYVMSSPGSEWSPVWEAMARQTVEKNAGPKFIDCWHETVAVDMALGYTAYTGKPQAVLIHAGVGLMHGSMAMLSATQQEIPMIVMSGESTSFGDDPDVVLEPQWYGGVSVGGAQRFVAPIVKWAAQVTSAPTLYQYIVRAGEMAQRIPQGPVYLNVSLEAMLAEWRQPDDLRRIPPPGKTQSQPQEVAEVAALLAAAENPVIVYETPGRDPSAFAALTALAEAWGMPAMAGRANTFASFPQSHPLWLGNIDPKIVAAADLILVVSGRTPWNPPSKRPGPGKIVSIGENPIKMQLAYQNLQADLYLEGDCAAALRLLAEAAKPDAALAAKIEARRRRWSAEHETMFARLKAAQDKALAQPTIDAVALAAVVGRNAPAGTIFTDETITHGPVMRPHLPIDQDRGFFRVTGGALGQGIAAAMGVKLAAPERPVVLFVGDGSFLYNPIIQALGASKAYELPITIVVCNNRKYEAMRKGHVMYYEGGVSDVTKLHFGVNIDGPEYHELGSHFGFYGAKVSTPADLERAFCEALAANREGRTAILNVEMSA